ncbi:LysR family transcriptional regulator [Acidihalobacter prosperus]|uniref:LysR family transcriptional regulator n=1 Tax=Acidihalobacter prosperus TaxID=160660 RepID=A0A1A6C7X0_9GAMM|nr:LysR family transcriptional regulator [Acidihalobacter prosperus]OBS10651.1 LysR family transcriptional regulator [Acidihalobacter prosperus]
MSIHAEHLLTFLHVAEQGGVAAGARLLHRSQPAVSERLRQLTEAVGEPLYQRVGRGIRLTPAGEALLVEARGLRAALDHVEEWIRRRRTLQDGCLRIVSSNNVASYFLHERLAAFRRCCPDIRLVLKTGALDWAIQAAGTWDLLFLDGVFADPQSWLPGFCTLEPWMEDEIVALLPDDHPLAGRGDEGVGWDELVAYPIVWREPESGVRRAVEHALAAVGLSVQFSVEVTGVEAVREAVSAGLGVGFASATALRRAQWPLQPLRLNPPQGLYWTLYLAAPKPDYRSAALNAFLDMLQTD